MGPLLKFMVRIYDFRFKRFPLNFLLNPLEKCQGPGDPGLCKNFLYKWRYESTTNACNTFVWGGCGGNVMNRFDSELECLQTCQVPEVPSGEKVSIIFVTNFYYKKIKFQK